MSALEQAVVERASGEQVSRTKSFLAAAAAGFAAAALTYKLLRSGGNLILSRCPTEWKERLRVWGQPRPDWAVAERVRAALDPHGAMNPGRFVF